MDCLIGHRDLKKSMYVRLKNLEACFRRCKVQSCREGGFNYFLKERGKL